MDCGAVDPKLGGDIGHLLCMQKTGKHVALPLGQRPGKLVHGLREFSVLGNLLWNLPHVVFDQVSQRQTMLGDWQLERKHPCSAAPSEGMCFPAEVSKAVLGDAPKVGLNAGAASWPVSVALRQPMKEDVLLEILLVLVVAHLAESAHVGADGLAG